jgi:hypothetical protein
MTLQPPPFTLLLPPPPYASPYRTLCPLPVLRRAPPPESGGGAPAPLGVHSPPPLTAAACSCWRSARGTSARQSGRRLCWGRWACTWRCTAARRSACTRSAPLPPPPPPLRFPRPLSTRFFDCTSQCCEISSPSSPWGGLRGRGTRCRAPRCSRAPSITLQPQAMLLAEPMLRTKRALLAAAAAAAPAAREGEAAGAFPLAHAPALHAWLAVMRKVRGAPAPRPPCRACAARATVAPPTGRRAALQAPYPPCHFPYGARYRTLTPPPIRPAAARER